MKIYNKKGFIWGIIWTVLAIWGFIHDAQSPNPNAAVQVRDSIVSVFVLLMGLTSFFRAFSKKATREDFIDERDERNRLVEYKTSKKMLEIAYGVLFVIMIGGMIGFKMTANMIWFAIFIIPGFLLGLFVIVEIFVKLYYDKKI